VTKMSRGYELDHWFDEFFGVDLEDKEKVAKCLWLLEQTWNQAKKDPNWDDYYTYFQECLYEQVDPLNFEEWRASNL